MSVRYYLWKDGDNMSSVSIRLYGDASRWRLLADQNRIRDVRKIKPGTQLRY